MTGTMLSWAGVGDDSEHILYFSLSLKCNTCSSWNALCHIFGNKSYPRKPLHICIPPPHPNDGECWLACSGHAVTDITESNCSNIISTRLCSACAVLGTGFSGTKSGPDQGGRTFPIGLIDQKQECLLHKAMFHISLSGSKTKSVVPLLKIHSYCTFDFNLMLNQMLSFASINLFCMYIFYFTFD